MNSDDLRLAFAILPLSLKRMRLAVKTKKGRYQLTAGESR